MNKINVLFMQSQDYFGSDSMIHSLMMRHFDRERVNVYAACNYGSSKGKSASLKALEAIPNLHVRPTHFGTSVNFRPKQQIVKDTLIGGVPAVKSLGGLVRYAKKHKIDIIHGTEKPRDAFYGLLLARLVGARSIVHLHVKVDTWMSPLTRFAMRHADALIGVSPFVAESAISKGYPRHKVHYVLNSLEAHRWDPTIDGGGVRQEFGIARDVPVLAIISRLFPWKGHSELLKALRQVKEQGYDFKLLLVGEDDPRATPGQRSYMAELKQLAQSLNLADRVIFTGFRKDIAQILSASDVFAMPSFEEPCAVAYLEAMAMRKPVVALESGGTPRLIDHGKAGLLSTPYDVEQLAANIITLLQNPESRVQMGTYARERVEEYFTPTRMADDVLQVYSKLLAIRDEQQYVSTNLSSN